MPPPYRPLLIGLDLDGTVVDGHNRIPGPTLAALHAVHDSGIAIAFLTGRRPLTAGPLLDTAGLPAFVATNSGCLMWRYPGWELLRRQLFPLPLIPQIAQLTAPYTVNFYCDTTQTSTEFIQLRRESTPDTEQHFARYGVNCIVAADVADLAGQPITQVALPGPEALTQRLCRDVRAALNGQVYALSVRWPLLPTTALEVFHAEATKGRALAYFAQLASVAQEDCLAAGDDVNDVPMLAWAGHGVAMPGAGAAVITAANESLPGAGAEVLASYLLSLIDLPRRSA